MAIDERAERGHLAARAGDLFARFVRESPDAIAISRLSDGRLVDVNDAFLEMMGFTRHEVIGRTTLEIGLWTSPEERERMLRALDAPSARVDFVLHTRAGEVRHIEASVQVIELDGEQCLLVVDRDVTDRKRAEAARRETQEMLRATIESTADGILVVDDRGHTAYANRRFAEMWRIPQDILETNSDDRMVAFVLDQLEHPEAFRSKVIELYATDREDFDTLRFKDGRIFERYSKPLMHDGRPAGRVWSFRDVTERRRAEEAVREAELRYRTLVEQIPAVTYVDAIDQASTALYISPQIERMLGHGVERWRDDPDLWVRLLHPDDLERVLAEHHRTNETGDPFRIEYRMFHRNGREVWIHDEATLFRDAEGRPRFWQGVMFDITERKRAEQQLERAWKKELEAGQRLRALDEMKNTFLEAVSHELRTPLTAVLGSALTLERDDLVLPAEERADLLRSLAANARKLHRLLGDLLDLDRLARGIVEPKRQPTDLSALVARVVAETETLEDHPVEVTSEGVFVSIDGPKVERIVENLLANTARHTPPGSPVSVRVQAVDGGAMIVVDDRGPGIPPERRADIFQPFQQLPSSNPHRPGVGIGLSLVSRFAELHGGRAWVQEREGGGASFRVFLPAG